MQQQPGSAFGNYDVQESIGHGGMGVVYRAVHRDLDREVALKVLASQFSADDEYRSRFLSEARTLARLESNNIVTIYDAGQHEGSLYLAMQLVTDGDLSVWLGSYGPMPPAVALDILRQVTTGLGAAHDAGVLHRDIKASNVLLRRLADGSTRAYLCDFGIAQTADVSHTRTGGVVGTWSYLAPERHQGVAASAASDVYALGCLLWAMLTGSTPYAGVTDVEVAIAHMNAPVPQLPGRSPAERALNQLLARMLDKDPARRLGSAGAVLDDIDQVAAVVSPDAGPVSAANRSRTGGSTGSHAVPPRDTRTQAATYGAHQPHQPHQPPRRRGRWIAGAVAAVVLVAATVGGVVLLGDRSGGGGDDDPTPGEVPFADDTEAGVVADAPLTVTECGADPAGLRIGGLLPFTGVLSTQAPAAEAGMGLAVSDINAAGGVLGEEVCHTTVDSGDEDALAEVYDAGIPVDGIVGPLEAQLAESIVPILEDEEIVHVSPTAWVSDISGVSPYSFRTIGDIGTMAGAIDRVIGQRSRAASAALVVADDALAIRARDAVEQELESGSTSCVYGCEGMGQEIPEGTTDFSALAAEVVASGAETVVVAGFFDGPSLLTALAAAGWDRPIFLSSVADDVLTGAPVELMAQTYSVFPAVQAPEAFTERVDEWYSSDSGSSVPTPFISGESYDAVVLMALAAQRGGATDGATIAENMRAVSGSEGGTQCRTFRRCAALLEDGQEIVYRGVAVPAPFTEDNDLSEAWFSVFTFEESGLGTREEEQVLGRKG